ncbi:hypothetical protein K7640_16930 [Micromonospora sp. PLK6-60]|uniref:hypothetical protein n=1 Tax=Micromonospora sp. PLK6-60 TaxID=2873383 RepID=UPI001CA6441E|nr:hypothetical protein [Micromonospora sp. PLK6-60]MBY8873522.1 hypothetical protein [Micromonospora sp. PLK6-60]
MKEEELHRLLTVAAEDVRPSRPASTGWERARRHRSRRAVAAVALAVALLTGATALALRPTGHAAPPAVPATPSATAAPVQRPPAEPAYRGGPLSRLTDAPAAPLSTRPVRRALALYQPVDRETWTGGEIRVLGDDGLVRSLDTVTPAATRDRGGNQAPALKPGQLSPDGRTAVFPQTDEVIVVDLTTAQVHRFPLGGYLELAVWVGDRVLVGGDDRTYLLDPVSGRADPVAGSIWETVAPDPAGSRQTVAELGGVQDGLVLRERSLPDGTVRQQRKISSAGLNGSYRVDEFYGRGWQRGNRIAQAGWTSTDARSGDEGVAVLDARTGAVVRLLDLGREGVVKACCEVLGWDPDGAVLLRHDAGALVRWQPETGEFTGVTRNATGQMALAAG